MLHSWSPADVLYKALESNSNSAWATINKINRPAAALRCSSLCPIATPCQDLASKDGIDSENKPTLQYENPTRAEKILMKDWEAWVRGQRIAMTIWCDPERSIRIWCLHEDDGLSFPYRLQKFPLFLSSSYRLQKFADTDRLRVNRRPIRKDFFPDRYDFVPTVFTSSSCKRGLTYLPSLSPVIAALLSLDPVNNLEFPAFMGAAIVSFPHSPIIPHCYECFEILLQSWSIILMHTNPINQLDNLFSNQISYRMNTLFSTMQSCHCPDCKLSCLSW